MEDIHIPDGIGVKLLLAALVLAGGVVGALGLGSATSQAAGAEFGDGGRAQLAFPIDNVSVGAGAQVLSLDGKGNDPYPTAYSFGDAVATFPIDNVTMAVPTDGVGAAFPIDNVSVAAPWDARDTDAVRRIETGSTGVDALSFARIERPDELPQDMDPY
jgi:hypothetical protein